VESEATEVYRLATGYTIGCQIGKDRKPNFGSMSSVFTWILLYGDPAPVVTEIVKRTYM